MRLGRHRSTIRREVTAAAGADRDADRAAQVEPTGPLSVQRRRSWWCILVWRSWWRASSRSGGRRHAIAAWLPQVSDGLRGARRRSTGRCTPNASAWGLAAGSWKRLASARRRRKPRSRIEQTRPNQLGPIRSVHTRPQGAGDRTEAGHWEGDLIMGAANRSAVVTLVERVSRKTMGDFPDGHTAPGTLACLLELYEQVPGRLRRSLTWEQGREMSDWELLEDRTASGSRCTSATGTRHGSDPANEHTNRMLRRWLPKGADLARFPQPRPDEIARHLNTMHRRLHQWASAGATMPSVATTGRTRPAYLRRFSLAVVAAAGLAWAPAVNLDRVHGDSQVGHHGR